MLGNAAYPSAGGTPGGGRAAARPVQRPRVPPACTTPADTDHVSLHTSENGEPICTISNTVSGLIADRHTH